MDNITVIPTAINKTRKFCWVTLKNQPAHLLKLQLNDTLIHTQICDSEGVPEHFFLSLKETLHIIQVALSNQCYVDICLSDTILTGQGNKTLRSDHPFVFIQTDIAADTEPTAARQTGKLRMFIMKLKL